MMAKIVPMKNPPLLSPSLRMFLDLVVQFKPSLLNYDNGQFSIERYVVQHSDRYRFPDSGLQDRAFCVSNFVPQVKRALFLFRVKTLLNAQTTINMMLDEGFVCVGFEGLTHIVDCHLKSLPNDKWILAPHCRLVGQHDIFHHPAVGIPYVCKTHRQYHDPEIKFSYSTHSLASIQKGHYLLFGKMVT
jgi:hypothetical protein